MALKDKTSKINLFWRDSAWAHVGLGHFLVLVLVVTPEAERSNTSLMDTVLGPVGKALSL